LQRVTYLLGDALILIKHVGHHQQIGAQPLGLPDAHPRTDPKLASLIVGSRDLQADDVIIVAREPQQMA
jgi:hypothetical protein